MQTDRTSISPKSPRGDTFRHQTQWQLFFLSLHHRFLHLGLSRHAANHGIRIRLCWIPPPSSKSNSDFLKVLISSRNICATDEASNLFQWNGYNCKAQMARLTRPSEDPDSWWKMSRHKEAAIVRHCGPLTVPTLPESHVAAASTLSDWIKASWIGWFI